MREATFTGITQYIALCCINRYNTNRSLTIVLLYGYHLTKSVSIGTDLIIILKNHSGGKQILYISIPLIHHEWLEAYTVIGVIIYYPLFDSPGITL